MHPWIARSMPPSQQQSTALLILSAVCAALIGYRAGVVASRRKKREETSEEERDGQQQTPKVGMQHHRLLRQLVHESTGRGFGVVKRVYVVPGGGPGSGEDAGYPPWTAQRVAKALQRYDVKYADTTAFIALGAGSMNAASARGDDGRVVFESTRIAEELARGGVPPGSIIADFASWDTVGNAWFARMAIEALLDIAFRHGDRSGQPHCAPPPPPPPTASTTASATAAATTPGVNETPPVWSPEELPYSEVAGYSGGGGGSGGGGDADAKRDDEERGVAVGGGLSPPPPQVAEEVKQVSVGREEAGKGRGGAGRGGGGRGGGGEGEEKLPAARAGEAYGGGEMRKWMFDFKAKKARARRGPLNVTVFVSDFHAERMDAVFQWVFGLEPSLLKGKATVTTVSIDTPVEMWASGAEERQARQAHERKAADQARLLAKEISTVEEFQAFLVLGGHRGYFDLTHGQYRASAGAGWGGPS